ncbi:MAG: hypothetical protein ABRQ39_08490 [Candidatus Eremiobacterota bacterium]
MTDPEATAQETKETLTAIYKNLAEINTPVNKLAVFGDKYKTHQHGNYKKSL